MSIRHGAVEDLHVVKGTREAITRRTALTAEAKVVAGGRVGERRRTGALREALGDTVDDQAIGGDAAIVEFRDDVMPRIRERCGCNSVNIGTGRREAEAASGKDQDR